MWYPYAVCTDKLCNNFFMHFLRINLPSVIVFVSKAKGLTKSLTLELSAHCTIHGDDQIGV